MVFLMPLYFTQAVCIQQTFEPGLRVTVAMGSKRSLEDGKRLFMEVLRYICLLSFFWHYLFWIIKLYLASRRSQRCN
jgi:hypothetical protein